MESPTGHQSYRILHFYNLQPTIDLWDEIGGARKRNRTSTDEAPEQRLVLSNPFPEWSSLEVDGKCRNLLGQTEQINGSIEKIRLELGFQIDFTASSVKASIISR